MHLLRASLVLLMLALLAFSVVRIVKIQRTYKAYIPQHDAQERNEQEGKGTFTPIFHFSWTGKNVLIVMLDRGLSCYVEQILEEKPELKKKYRGFVFYPNTISYGSNTIFGSPTLYGGYEYTPLEMNKRDGELMRDKQNEALKVLPALFTSQGWHAVFTNPAWSNYNVDFDATPFEGIPNLEVKDIEGKYKNWWLETQTKGKTVAYSEVLSCNLWRYAVFQTAPLFVRKTWYDKGSWLNSMNPRLDTGGLDEHFVKDYSTMAALPYITSYTDEGNYLNIYDTMLTHDPVSLAPPNYVPGEGSGADRNYSINAVGARLVARWFEQLKQEGVYDNTRIILVSDHGWGLGSQAPDYLTLPGGGDLNNFRAVLMEKDFDAQGELRVDQSFMTNADVPALVTKDLLDNPKNPFTGKKLTMDGKKDGVTITTSGRHMPYQNSPTQFLFCPGELLHVKDDIRQIENWSVVR